MASFIKDLLRVDQTVFTFQELLIMHTHLDRNALKARLNYYVKKGDLYHIRRGLYAKDANYDRYELATKIYKPCYISFETVLRSAGIIFQYYSQIFIATYQTRDLTIDGQGYVFKKLTSKILTNGIGVIIKDSYSIASPERAFLDAVYIYRHYHFDNLDPLNWDKVYEILPSYGDNKSMRQRVDKYYQSYKDEVR